MLGGNSRKFSRRQFKIQLSGDNLAEQKILESAFSETLKSKILATLTSGIYWIYYKPPVLSYSKVGTYDYIKW